MGPVAISRRSNRTGLVRERALSREVQEQGLETRRRRGWGQRQGLLTPAVLESSCTEGLWGSRPRPLRRAVGSQASSWALE